MAFYSRKEFAVLCGYEWSEQVRAKVGMWITRKSIIVDEDGRIDDIIPKNRDWILKHRDSQQQKSDKTSPGQSDAPQIKLPFAGSSIESQLKEHQIEKLKVDTRIAELKEEKIRGEVVPIDIIKSLFRTHTQSIITSQKDGIEELLINFAAEVRLSSEQFARLRGKMISILNEGVDKAIITTERSMTVMVEDFSIKKEVGEHD